MGLFAIADLHLCGSDENRKSMAVFDDRWLHSRQKLEKNWKALVSPDDFTVIPGDISWAMSLEEAAEDFAFIDSLPGTKLISKGNHDFWWSTAAKMNAFFKKNGFSTLKIMYNNSYVLGNMNLCGTRGWFPDPMNQKTVGETDWEKISVRETLRLRHSLDAKALPLFPPAAEQDESVPASTEEAPETVVFFHFPPVWNGYVCRGIVDTLKEYGIKRCYFGHIHGIYDSRGTFEFEGIRFQMISADHLDFAPLKVGRPGN